MEQKSIVKAALHHVPFVFIFYGNLIYVGWGCFLFCFCLLVLFLCGGFFLLYDIQKLLTESLCGNSKAIQNVCELIKNGKKWQHCQVCHFTGEKFIGGNKKKSVPYKSPIWAQPVQSGPFAAHLAGPPCLIWLHKWTLYSSGGKKKCKDVDVNCFPDWSLARDKSTK